MLLDLPPTVSTTGCEPNGASDGTRNVTLCVPDAAPAFEFRGPCTEELEEEFAHQGGDLERWCTEIGG